MKKVLIIIFIMFFSQNIMLAEEELIWDFHNDEYIKELIHGQTSITQVERQKQIDNELSKNLGIDLVYTNLEECLKIAVENNYSLKISNAKKKESYWTNKNAKSQILPDLNYTYDIKHLDGTFLVGGIVPDDVDEIPIQSFFTLDWYTYKQGKLIFLNRQTKQQYRAASANLEYSRDEVILKTTLAYYDLLKLKFTFDVLRTNLIDRNEQYKLMLARYKAGVGEKFDVVRAEAEVAKAKQLYIEGFNRLRLAQAKLSNIIGIEVLNAVYPSESSAETRELLDPTYDIEKLYQTALLTRDDVKSLKATIEATKAERGSVCMEFAPNIRTYYMVSQQGTARLGLYPSTTLGFVLTQPLGQNLGVGTVTKVKSFNAKIEAENYRLTNLTRGIKESIIGSYYDSKTALERIEATKKEVKASDDSLRIAIVRMQVGQATFLDVIQAQSLKVRARETLVNTIIEYNKAQAQLLFDSGIISVGNVLKNYQSIPPPP